MLADRGFNIHDATGMYCAEVKLPLIQKERNNSVSMKWIKLVNYQELEYM